MESFKEYIELKEEREYAEQILNEDPVTIAGAILGYAVAGLVLGWGGALIVQGYAKLGQKVVGGIRRTYRKFTGKDKSSGDVNKTIMKLKTDPKIRMAKNKQDDEAKKYADDMKDVNAAIKDKDADKTKEALKDVRLDRKVINRLVILEATKAFGEPPLHFGSTGNETYLFVKKVLGMKTAQAASFVVKKSLEDMGAELVKNVEKDSQEQE